MKGLTVIPGEADLADAYGKLQARDREPAVEELALWSQWARFDPRLAEQWVDCLSRRWRGIAPAALHEALSRQPWPQSFGVLTEQLKAFGGLSKDERRLFDAWAGCALTGVRRAADEQYFIGHRAFAGSLMRQDALLTTRPYRRWGYLGREILVNKARPGCARTWLPPVVRRRVLEELLRASPRLTVADYRRALDNAVSMRQAQRDLAVYPKARGRGRTRSKTYGRAD